MFVLKTVRPMVVLVMASKKPREQSDERQSPSLSNLLTNQPRRRRYRHRSACVRLQPAMTIKKIMALVSVACLFLGNSAFIRTTEQSAYAAMIVVVTIVSTMALFGAVLAASRNLRIASGAAAWWLCLSIASILIPLSTTLDNDDMGVTNFVCLLLGAVFGYLGVVLWIALPWDPLVEDGDQSRIALSDLD